jgi:hypothetical protein
MCAPNRNPGERMFHHLRLGRDLEEHLAEQYGPGSEKKIEKRMRFVAEVRRIYYDEFLSDGRPYPLVEAYNEAARRLGLIGKKPPTTWGMDRAQPRET